MYEVNEAARVITQSADPTAKIIFGAVIDEALKDDLKITVIATGFGKGARPAKKMMMSGQATPSSFDAPVTMPERPRPTPPPTPANLPRVPKTPPAPTVAPEDDLEIPAFIRKKML